MQRFVEVTGEKVDAAIENALRQLGLDRDDVSVEVLDKGKHGFLGIGATPARVRVSYEVPDQVLDRETNETPSIAAPTSCQDTLDENTSSAICETKAAVQHAPVCAVQEPVQYAPNQTKKAVKSQQQAHGPRERKPVAVSEQEMDRAEQRATEFVDGLLERMGIQGKTQRLPGLECDQLRIEIVGRDMGAVIGRRGDTLDAIQYLCSLVVNQQTNERIRVWIDTEHYRQKRADSLEHLAHKMADKVKKSHRAMTLEPMNPYERRMIHAALQEVEGVTTYSTGSEPGRRVVIAPKNHERWGEQ